LFAKNKTKWKQFIWERDEVCQICGGPADNCYHLKSPEAHPELALDTDNGLLVCKKCQGKLDYLKHDLLFNIHEARGWYVKSLVDPYRGDKYSLEETAILVMTFYRYFYVSTILARVTESKEYILNLLRTMQSKGLVEIMYGSLMQISHFPSFIEFSPDDDSEDLAIEYALKALKEEEE
jgi:hypothetical protein